MALFVSVITPIVNYFVVESTDWSSSYQEQIVAYNFTKNSFFEPYGAYAYLIEAALISAFAIPILFFLTLLLLNWPSNFTGKLVQFSTSAQGFYNVLN